MLNLATPTICGTLGYLPQIKTYILQLMANRSSQLNYLLTQNSTVELDLIATV